MMDPSRHILVVDTGCPSKSLREMTPLELLTYGYIDEKLFVAAEIFQKSVNPFGKIRFVRYNLNLNGFGILNTVGEVGCFDRVSENILDGKYPFNKYIQGGMAFWATCLVLAKPPYTMSKVIRNLQYGNMYSQNGNIYSQYGNMLEIFTKPWLYVPERFRPNPVPAFRTVRELVVKTELLGHRVPYEATRLAAAIGV